MKIFVSIAVCSVIAYLLGSVNFAIIITRIFAKKDIRDCGSGNAGMTNVLRTVGKFAALLTLIGDFSKGIISVYLMQIVLYFVAGISDFYTADYFVAFCALIGHVFPVFYNFKGGKGILVSFGALVALSPVASLICLCSFLIAVVITKYVSLGSIISSIVYPISILLLGYINIGAIDWIEVICTLPISLLIIFMHRSNIKRLLAHNENKISLKKK